MEPAAKGGMVFLVPISGLSALWSMISYPWRPPLRLQIRRRVDVRDAEVMKIGI
jgi:hypothetical protein